MRDTVLPCDEEQWVEYCGRHRNGIGCVLAGGKFPRVRVEADKILIIAPRRSSARTCFSSMHYDY